MKLSFALIAWAKTLNSVGNTTKNVQLRCAKVFILAKRKVVWFTCGFALSIKKKTGHIWRGLRSSCLIMLESN